MANSNGWIYFSYARGRVEMRIEPNDPDRVDAIKSAIPEEDRFYKRDSRSWCFNPKWCPDIIEIIRHFCPGFPIILEESNGDLLETLLSGPGVLLQPGKTAPKGREFGTTSDLASAEEREE